RPLLHICLLNETTGCLNISLALVSPQQSILPLRMNIVHVKNLKPPLVEEENAIEIHVNHTTTPLLTTIFIDQDNTNDSINKTEIIKSRTIVCSTDKSNLKMILGFLTGFLVCCIGITILTFTIRTIKRGKPIVNAATRVVNGGGSSGLSISRNKEEDQKIQLLTSESSDTSSSYKPETIL
ncbi:unnamed protein product, partial [Didymodactylos carnosus]